MPDDVIDIPLIGRTARVQSIDEASRTFEVVWTTGSQVRRYSWARDEEFDEELVIDPASIRLGRLGAGAPFLDSHRSWGLNSVLGVVVEGSIRVEGGRGYARIRMSERDEVAPVWSDIRGGIIRNVSVGYQVHRYERVAKADRADGGARALYRAVDWEPYEISAVAIGADPGAQVRGETPDRLNPCVVTRRDTQAAPAARAEEGHMPEPREPADGSVQVETRAAPAAPETNPAPAAPVDVEARIRAATEAERKRVADIKALCRRHQLTGTFEEGLVERGASLSEARDAVLDELVKRSEALGPVTRPHAPAQPRGTGAQDVAYRDAISASLLHRHNPGRNPLPDDAREFRGLTLLELARSVLERHGIGTRGLAKMEVAAQAFQMRAAIGYHSTSDFPAILANVANKTLRAAYESTPRTFAAWARRATITDFKPVQRTQLGGAPDLHKVLESGEFQYGTIGEGSEVYALATYGRIVGITRQTLVNDDLDAFTRVPAAFGASAADLESDIVYEILMSNPNMADGAPLFGSGTDNLGTASVIDEAALAEAYRLMAKQRGIEGRLVRVLPQYILVPPGTRSVEARKQVADTTPASTDDVNVFARRLQVVEEPRLIPSAGQDPWFLAADPNRIDTIEYAYLDGQEGVFTETRMGFEVDGMEIKARHDFAAKAIDRRGLYKNAGAAPS